MLVSISGNVCRSCGCKSSEFIYIYKTFIYIISIFFITRWFLVFYNTKFFGLFSGSGYFGLILPQRHKVFFGNGDAQSSQSCIFASFRCMHKAAKLDFAVFLIAQRRKGTRFASLRFIFFRKPLP